MIDTHLDAYTVLDMIRAGCDVAVRPTALRALEFHENSALDNMNRRLALERHVDRLVSELDYYEGVHAQMAGGAIVGHDEDGSLIYHENPFFAQNLLHQIGDHQPEVVHLVPTYSSFLDAAETALQQEEEGYDAGDMYIG